MTTTTTDQSARGMLDTFLGQYGLEGLGQWAWDRYRELGGGTDAMNVITLELTKRPEFAARFPAIAERARLGLTPISPADYVHYEMGLHQMMVQYGVPFDAGSPKFNEYVQRLLVGDKSLTEVQSDLANGFARVANGPQSVRDYFAEKFGASGDAALAAVYLDPEASQPELDRMTQAAVLGGTASQFGIRLEKTQALDLAQHVTTGDGSQQFAQVEQMNPLYAEQVGETKDITQQQGVEAAFGIGSAVDLERRRAERVAKTSGSGGAATTSGGVIGAGSAPPA